MADKRLKSLLRSAEIGSVLGNYGFKESDVLPGVALAAAAVLTDKDGKIRGVRPDGRPTLCEGVPSLFPYSGGVTLTELKKIPTKDLRPGHFIFATGYGGDDSIGIYRLKVGTSQSNWVQVRPDDYDAANPRFWQLQNFEADSVEGYSGVNSSNGNINTNNVDCLRLYSNYVEVYYYVNMVSGSIMQWNSGTGVLGLPNSTNAYYLTGSAPSGYLYVDGSGFVKRTT
jgi:hypothetical protein